MFKCLEGAFGAMVGLFCHDLGIVGLEYGNNLSICRGKGSKAVCIWPSLDPVMAGAVCTGIPF